MKPSHRNPLLRNLVLAASICLAFGQAANAGSVYWDTNTTTAGSGAATGTWGTSLFWTTTEAGTATPNGTLPTANDDVFIAAGTTGTTGIITISGAQVAGSLTLQEPALNPGVVISGGTSLTLGGGSTTTKGLFVTGNGFHTVSTPLILSGANTIQTTGVVSNLSLLVNGGITGTGNLTLNNNSTGTTGIQLLAAQINTVGSITNTGTNTGTVIIGNAASTTGTGGLSTTVTSVNQDSANSPLQFLNANNSTYAGNYNINAGTLQMAGTNTGPGVGTNLGTITATHSTSVFNLGATTGAAAATLNIVNNAVSGKVNNNINVRAGSTGTKSISVNSSVTFATSGVITLDDNLTVSPASGGSFGITFNGLIQDGTSGPKGLVKAGAGDATLPLANTYSGATSVTAGNLILTGTAGALPNTSGVSITGGIFRLNNTAASNNTNRIPDSTVITINGGTLNFNHNAGAANYSETVAVTAASTGTVSTSQAAVGQTSVLTIGTFTRNPGSVLTFSGTGLGVDSTNQILFTSAPTTINGVLPWATYGTTGFAGYDLTNGIVAITTVDIDAQGSTIADDSTSNLRINLDGTGSNIALGGATTTSINTLVQANTAVTTPTIDTASKTLRVNGVLLSSVANTKGLTIGAAQNDGTLTAGTTGGELLLVNNSASALTLNAVIANNSSASSVTKTGTGDATFAGNNTYTGATTLSGGVITAANDNAFGSGTITITNPTKRLVVNNGVTISNAIIVNGGGEAFLGLIQNSAASGNATLAGPITISGTLAAGGHFASTGTDGTLTITGPITSTSTSPVVRAGTVIMSGIGTASNYATFNASAGVTRLGASDALLPSATLDMGASADSRFDLNGFNQTLAGITRTGSNTFIGNASITGDSTLTTTGTSTYSGSILNVLSPGTMKTFLKVDSGNLTLTGAFSAETATINNTGTLTIGTGSGDTIAPAAKLITINNGGTLKFTGSNRIQNDTVIDIKSGGTFDENSQFDTIGHIKGAGSITNLGSALTLALPAVGSPAEFSGTISGTYSPAGNNAALVLRCDGTGASAASTLILSGANTGFVATGTNSTVNVQGGRLIGRNTAAFGPAGQIITVGNSALTLDPTIEFQTDSPMNSYVLNVGSGNTGTIELNRATPGAALTQSAGTSTLGNGTLNIEKGANVTSGTPVLEFAALSLSAGSGGLGAATLNPVGVNISVLGNVTRPGGSSTTLKLDGTSTGNVIAGNIQDNGANKLSVIKQNTSTWTLSGPNGYTGTTTVNGGTLHLTGSLAAGSAVTVGGNSASGTPTLTGVGGTVNGTLTIAAAGTGVAGTVNPGTVGTTGTLNAGATTIAGTYACDVVSATTDLLAVTGNLDITGATFALNAVTPTPGTYTIATYTGALAGTFTASPALPTGYVLDYATTGQIKLTVPNTATPYQTWGGPYGLTAGSEGGDLDNDGLSNFQEFAFGLIPNNGSSVNPITSQLSKTTGQFTYQRLAASGLAYTIWTSSDLVNWNQDTGAIQTPTAAGANESVQVTLSATVPLAASKTFVRVKAN